MRPFPFAVITSQVPTLRPWEITHDRWFERLAGIPIHLEGIRLGLWLLGTLGLVVSPFPCPRTDGADERVLRGWSDLIPTHSQLGTWVIS